MWLEELAPVLEIGLYNPTAMDLKLPKYVGSPKGSLPPRAIAAA